ncbi:alpha/beta hydrolase [Spongiactinospora sp. TRM90649]|uniref:alpha/beta fold hydrolase n=1 Tax=Spongiactinospora sp. TRM90649 TaxID=3031114 RepID=UPI0023F86191|nr:alpha/beta hydrolase [Spongiactinospora sp. TRM90649]MDF5753355.1 alpha/beta hydrolase [Spongiactinospora sp. TRM90649]
MNEFSRRNALKSSAFAGVAGVAGAGAGGMATGSRKRRVTTYVFVTGANGGTSADSELALRGHRTVAVELPGHGSADTQFRASYQAPQDLRALASEPSIMAGVTLDDYVKATVATVRRAAAHGPVILVGGSMGGVTITKAADAVPDLIDHLVYDSAFCCTELPSADSYLSTPEGSPTQVGALLAGVLADPATIGAVRINWRTADPAFLGPVKAALMADGSDAEFMAMLNGSLPDDSPLIATADARGRKEAWGRVPRTYIRHSEDRLIPIALQNRMIREADALTPGNRFNVRTVRCAHAPARAAWAKIVDILDGLA